MFFYVVCFAYMNMKVDDKGDRPFLTESEKFCFATCKCEGEEQPLEQSRALSTHRREEQTKKALLTRWHLSHLCSSIKLLIFIILFLSFFSWYPSPVLPVKDVLISTCFAHSPPPSYILFLYCANCLSLLSCDFWGKASRVLEAGVVFHGCWRHYGRSFILKHKSWCLALISLHCNTAPGLPGQKSNLRILSFGFGSFFGSHSKMW